MQSPPFHSGGSGEPMVLLHGFTNDWRCWAPILPSLESRFCVFAPTLAGHLGGEDLPAGVKVSTAAIADAVEGQMDARGIEAAHLVGNSLGGLLSLELAGRGRALSVVALCPAGGWEVGSPEARSVIRSFKRAQRGLRLSRPWFEAIAKRPRMRAIAFREAVARPERLSAGAALAMFEAAAGCRIVDGLLDAARTEALGELGPIECPVTIATATADRLFRGPAYFSELRRRLPDASWVTLENLGHVPMTDDPDLVMETILAGARADRPTRVSSD
jgi:pimeloyl-ACP methyl ester carboxylesterase